MRVVAIGECTLDRYLGRGVERIGGISLNFAVNARRAGASSAALLSCVGDDAAAALVLAKLDDEGVERALVRQLPGPTAVQEIDLRDDGERIFPPGSYSAGVLARYQVGEEERRALRGADVVAAPYFAQVRHLFDPILDPLVRGRRVADLLEGADCGPDLAGVRAILPLLDIVFISGERGLAERLRPLSEGATLIVVTHGPAGSTALLGGQPFYQPALAVPQLRDTTGAGDAFQAGFAVAYFGGASAAAALLAGAERAARVIQVIGSTEDR